MIRIELLSPQREADYHQLLLSDTRSLIYSTLEYRDFLSLAVGGSPQYLVAIDDAGRLVGVLPFFEQNVPGVGTVINSLPWYGSHGSCVVAADAPLGVRDALLKGYVAAQSGDILTATLILSPFEETYRSQYESFVTPIAIDHRVGQITTLPEAGDALGSRLESTIAQKTRNLVRKSLKQGFSLHRDESDWAWAFLFEIHQANMLAVGGRAKPWSHFQALREALPPALRQLSIAMLDGEPVAAMLLLYFNKTVEYFTPVICQHYRSLQPLSFLIWHGMLDAVDRGFCWWNWGGTWASQHSLHHFKAGWGGVDHPYTYLINASDRGLAMLRSDRQGFTEHFPYYYAFPFDQLDVQ
jgi:hypothetical protein